MTSPVVTAVSKTAAAKMASWQWPFRSRIIRSRIIGSRIIGSLAFCLVVLAFSLTLAAQNVPISIESKPDKKAALPTLTADELEKMRTDVSAKIESLEIAMRAVGNSPDNQWLADAYAMEVEQLRYLELIYAQHQALLLDGKDIESEDEAIETELKRYREQQLATGRYATFTELEELRDAMETQAARVETIEAEIKSGASLKKVVDSRLASNDRKRRLLLESYDSSDPSLAMKKIEKQINQAKLGIKINRATIDKIRLEKQYYERELKVAKRRLETMVSVYEAIEKHVVFTKDDLAQQLVKVRDLESELREQLKQIEQLDEELDKQLSSGLLDDESLTTVQRAEILGTIELLRENLRLRTAYVNSTLAELVVVQFCWKKRFEIAQEIATPEALQGARDITETFRQRLHDDQDMVRLHLQESHVFKSDLEDRIVDETIVGDPVLQWLQVRLKAVENLLNLGSDRLDHLNDTDELLSRLELELQDESTADSTSEAWSAIYESCEDWWTYDLIQVDDEKISVGKLLSAFLLLIIGLIIARKLSRTLGGKMFPRLGMQEGGSLALQTIMFYGLCVLFTFFTLETLNIPLTVFTFFGGAAAIAIGFGSQTLLNNFISGLILLGEQPVRVGDLVQIDGIHGNITHIGARSTKMLTGENMEIIVPNSKFMELKLTNWTLSNTDIRINVAVGVAYGSPTDRVIELLQQALEQTPEVKAEPEPIILFSDFGADSLNFEVHFWIHMRLIMDAKRAKSNVRRKIDQLFRENDITISFPQRDVHLDIDRPIEINLVEPHHQNQGRRAA
ncbi:MAG: mechanosensitive ion channel [Mariniblastus sp.]|nr:mechanosensitive ion channel [Mariniblastus sp.]